MNSTASSVDRGDIQGLAAFAYAKLTEARYLPGRLLQTQPGRRAPTDVSGLWTAIDLDLSRYDSIATRFAAVSAETWVRAPIDSFTAVREPLAPTGNACETPAAALAAAIARNSCPTSIRSPRRWA